jgi:hypothetical protein
MGHNSENPNGSTNSNLEKPAKLEGMKGQQHRHVIEEVWVNAMFLTWLV